MNAMNLSIALITMSFFVLHAVHANTKCNVMKCQTDFDQCITDVHEIVGLVNCHMDKSKCVAPCSVSRKGLRMGSIKLNSISGCVNECTMEFDGCGLKTFGAEEVHICVRNYESQCKAKCKLSQSLRKMKKLNKLEKRLEKINRKMKTILASK